MRRIAIAAILAGLGTIAATVTSDDRDPADACVREAPHVSAVHALAAAAVSRSLALIRSSC